MSKRPPKKPRIQPIRDQEAPKTASETAVAVEDPPEPPEPEPEPPKQEPEPPKPKGRPPGGGNPLKTQLTFFQRVGGIALADWGTRAKIRVYRLQPIIDRTRGSEFKFVQIYHEAIDENKIKADHGSGRYRLYLNLKSAGQREEKEIDMIEIDILDPKFPPNIPPGEWVDDPRNKKWAWARPAGAPGSPQAEAAAVAPQVQAAAASQFIEGVKAAGEIRKELKQEIAPDGDEKKPSGVGETLQLVQTIMAMKADNPMVDVMKEQLRISNESAEKARDREAALQKELRDSMRAKPDGERFGMKEMLKEVKEFLPSVKELLPQVGEAARATRSNWIDVFRDIAPPAIDYVGKIAVELISRMPQAPAAPMNGAQPHAALPAPQQQAGQQAQQQQPPPNVPKFVQFLSQPLAFDSFRRYFEGFKKDDGQTGADFAQWVFDGGGAEPLKDARALGSANIMALLKQSPAWIMFQADEQKLSEFIDQTLAWTAPEPEPDDGDDDDEDAVDLTAKGI